MPLKNPKSGSEQVLNKQAIGLSRDGEQIFTITRRNKNENLLEFSSIEAIKDVHYYINIKNTFHTLLSILKDPPKLFDQITRETPFSAVIAHQPFTCFSLLLANKINRIPILYVYHSPCHAEYKIAHENDNRLKRMFNIYSRKSVERFCLRKSSAIMVLSRYMEEKIRNIHKIQNNHIIVNPGGCDLKQFKPVKNRIKIKKELCLPDDKIHLLTVRNLEPRMGLDNLVYAIKFLKEMNIKFHLTLGGEGPEKEKLEKMVDGLGLVNQVTMVGFIPSNMLSSYYSAADFFILPTRDLEGFGLVTPESLACGTPVLGTPVGGTREILEKFDSKFIFKDSTPDSIAKGIQRAIDEYFSDKEKYNRIRVRCRQYAEQSYSWQRHIDLLESIIYQMLEPGKIIN